MSKGKNKIKQKGEKVHDLDYYMNLPYKVELVPIREEEGGGYMARLPLFGKQGIIGDGETKEEALADLEKAKGARFERYLEEGLAIPEPQFDEEDFSGRFVLRLPKFLHRDLVLAAKDNGVSLNQFVVSLLSVRLGNERVFSLLMGMVEKIQSMNDLIGRHFDIGGVGYHDRMGAYQMAEPSEDEYRPAA
jgi:predicted HicB family RNase H-like nuclease